MKIVISYFYQIRHFKPNMIPLSTAVFDPKWYHNFEGYDRVWLDKNKIINGLRCKPLVPGESCKDLCKGTDNCEEQNPLECLFLKNYRNQLEQIDFRDLIAKFERASSKIQEAYNIEDEPIIVLIVYETPDNKCSERQILIDWFKFNGYNLEELKYPISENY